MVMIVALGIAGLVALGLVLVLIDLLRRLFWLAARLAASMVVGLVGVVVAIGLAAPGSEWIAAPVALALAIGVLRTSRGWGKGLEPADPPGGTFHAMAATDDAPLMPTQRTQTLLDPALHQRLATIEKALARAARDDLGQPAAEWLTFHRCRVPDLITAARDVFDDGDDAVKAAVAGELAVQLEAIVAEADRRLVTILKARQDLFTTRARHAQTRISGG